MSVHYKAERLIDDIVFEQTGVTQYHEWGQTGKKQKAKERRDVAIQKLKDLISSLVQDA